MEIKISDKNVVCFEYNLKSDTPQYVSQECVRDIGFDAKYICIIKDKIINILEYYKEARNKYLKASGSHSSSSKPKPASKTS